MQDQRQTKAPWPTYLVLVILLLAIIICALSLYRQQMNVLLRGIEPSCNIALGTSTITVQDWQASDICQAMLTSADNFTGVNWAKLDGTLVSEPSSGSIMCEMDVQNIHLVVRDSLPSSRNGIITCGILDGSVPRGVYPQ